MNTIAEEVNHTYRKFCASRPGRRQAQYLAACPALSCQLALAWGPGPASQ